ncbi:MAG TPA: undecaprenyldiphospho-muramoylpentapeptide beta-N-acetylglucosaminyltransferase, partial [Terriglobia bacterium]|nr:undecaprenyldiphospho-muramoylpentapeptide beta-N-acetylglucosaminyltransferase [Terriglobia bacterium]
TRWNRWQIEFVGGGRDIESRVIPSAGFVLHSVAAAGLKGIGGVRKVRNLAVLPRSFWDAAALLSRFRPHVVAGMGGYVSGPVMLEASLARIPTLLIETNATPGFTNRALAPFIRMAAVGFGQTAVFYGAKARVTGHPVRAAFHNIPAKRHSAPFTLLVLGGSQGAMAINTAVVGALPILACEAGRFVLIHQTGERDFERVSRAYAEARVQADVRPFIDDMPHTLAAADLVICRSGASTVAELAAAGRASLLIPFPGATDSHQLDNARVMERAGGARVMEQRQLTPKSLVEAIRSLVSRSEILLEMDRGARSLARPDAASRIADLIETLVIK